MTGLGNAVTGLGLSYPITACKDSLRTFEAALMRSEALKLPDWGKALGACLGLESLDVSGCRALTDDFFMQMCNFEIKNKDNTVTKPGFQHLHTAICNSLVEVNGSSYTKLLQTAKDLSNLEIAGCELM